MARRARYFDEEAEIFAAIVAEGCRAGDFASDDPRATAHTLLLATNALLPSSLSVGELGKRREVEERVSAIAGLLLDGLRARPARSGRRGNRLLSRSPAPPP
jgi:hypothetical protein